LQDLVNVAFQFTASSFKVCPKASPNLAQCLKEAIEAAKPYLSTGNFGEGFQTETLDPLTVSDVSVNKGVQIELTNMQANGIENFTIDKIRVNADKFKVSPKSFFVGQEINHFSKQVEILGSLPKVNLLGKYKMNMKLAAIELKGNGRLIADVGKYITTLGVLIIRLIWKC